MKRKLLVGALASSVAVGGAVGASALSDSMTSTSAKSELEVESEMGSQAALNTKKLIGVEELQDIVLSEVEGSIEEVELETQGEANTYFEVEVHQDSKQYELHIDAYTGKVLKVEESKGEHDENCSHDDDAKHNTKVESDVKTDIKAEANTESQVSTKSKTESETNVKPETKTETTEKQDDTSDQTKEQSTISKEQAIKIALGVSTGKVAEVELDEDNNQLYYDIELKGALDSEVKVDAYTGSIIDIELGD